jgi:hypothetical protein
MTRKYMRAVSRGHYEASVESLRKDPKFAVDTFQFDPVSCCVSNRFRSTDVYPQFPLVLWRAPLKDARGFPISRPCRARRRACESRRQRE